MKLGRSVGVWLLGLAACCGMSCSSDGGQGKAQTGGYCGTLIARQRECGFLGPGKTGCVNYLDKAEQCETACIAAATCAGIGALTCGITNLDIQICLGRCVGLEPVTCADGTLLGGYTRCDGSSQCSTDPLVVGADEQGCASVGYKCRNVDQRVDFTKRCDGVKDCSDGSDETPDCAKALTCVSTGTGVSMDVMTGAVCNGVSDCADGSDEADCAMRTCTG